MNEREFEGVRAGLSTLRALFEDAGQSSQRFGRQTRQALVEVTREGDRAAQAGQRFSGAFGGAFEDLLVKGQSVSSVLRSLAADLARIALNQTLPSLFEGTASGLAGAGKKSGGIVPFAKGGVVSRATLFSMGQGLGVAGEAGPEAILPLRRSSDGRLGVAAGGGAQPVTITFNVIATDAASFKRSETQLAAMLQRSLARGSRNL